MPKAQPLNSITARGKIHFTPTDPPRDPGYYVFQRVKPGLGNVTSDPTRSLQLRSHVTGTDPATAPQLTRRSQFATAVATWHGLADHEKAYWRERGQKRAITGINAYVSAYMRFEI